MQGRPGPSPLQPYRELRRLWGKSGVAPTPRTLVYELAPAVVAGSLLIASVLLPIGGRSPGWPVGHDALVLVGLLALGRFAITLAAWDTAGGFGLMGAGRDLTFAVAVEAVLLLVLVARRAARRQHRSARAQRPATRPAVWARAGALGGGVRVRARRAGGDRPPAGRQPRHPSRADDGPRGAAARVRRTRARLPAVGGGGAPLDHARARDRAVRPAAAARSPHGSRCSRCRCRCGACCWRCVETTQAKMRILRVPLFVGAGGAVCLLGSGELVRRRRRVTDALTWALVISALGVVVVRRRVGRDRADRAAVGVAGRAGDRRSPAASRPRCWSPARCCSPRPSCCPARAGVRGRCARARRSGSPPSATRSSG